MRPSSTVTHRRDLCQKDYWANGPPDAIIMESRHTATRSVNVAASRRTSQNVARTALLDTRVAKVIDLASYLEPYGAILMTNLQISLVGLTALAFLVLPNCGGSSDNGNKTATGGLGNQ